MYRFIIERGDKIVHLRVQKYSSPKIRSKKQIHNQMIYNNIQNTI
jgi:dUTPase